ncbi:MAG: PilN domain-containing protein [Candidatus Riflebacteria bacterium]|nr:PilN domain-containing protein [Candidatus Riflebacteria bacterium]
MKHFLNFKPTIVFRKGSSFMLKTSLIILYAVPVALALFWGYSYFAVSSVNQFYKESETLLASKTSKFGEAVAKLRPAGDDLESKELAYYDYRKISGLAHTSWSNLLNRLEKLAPDEMRFTRIGIKPDKIVRVSLEGEVMRLSVLTDFLRLLFAEKVFMNPNLKKHSKAVVEGGKIINFSLEVDYAGETGELPQ